jgi:replicative DNA helicase
MPDMRMRILDEIMAWARNSYSSNNISVNDTGEPINGSSGPQRIYWLNGMAGTGKSTIARTIACQCITEGRLGASFFFSSGSGELEMARTFVTSIAVQLARLPFIRPDLRSGLSLSDADAVTGCFRRLAE